MAIAIDDRRVAETASDSAADGSFDDSPGEERPADILVVDDNPKNLLAVEAALGPLGCRLVMAGSGAEALRCILRQDFALILLDVQMPDMDGFETARFVRERERSRHVPIIFVTAFSRNEQELLHAYELGAVDFLFKPIVPAVLRAKAGVFVELRRRNQEVMRQARLLREHEKREQERLFDEERSRWEAEALRREMTEQKRVAEELTRRADELSRTVAERERVEQELVRINGELELADRRKDEFLAILGHELRNPLAPIVTGLEILDEQELVHPSHVMARRTIKRQVEQLTRLVDDLLDVARITSGRIELRREPTDLARIVEQGIATSRPSIEKGAHELEVHLPEEPATLVADPIRVAQIVSNLLNNAARYTEPGGKIVLSAEIVDDGAVITVADNGKGIPPELLSRVFDMFVQSDPVGGQGLGLGLTLVRRLVMLHGGRVEARSAGIGQGSTFVVTLPVAPDRITEVPERTSRSRVAEGQRKRPNARGEVNTLVVIDDNDDVRQTLCVLLERWGFTVLSSDNGEGGVELVKSTRPDVAFVDIGMPGLDGYGVAARLREEMSADSPLLVAMTGYGQEHDRERAFSAGFDTHLVKPVDPETLRRVLSRPSS